MQVIPHRARLSARIAARGIWLLSHLIAATLRWSWVDRSGLVGPEIRKPLIFVFWHNRLAVSYAAYRIYFRRYWPERRVAALVSASRDGGLLSRALELFDVKAVRGSSSRRGPQALRELVSAAEQGFDLAVTPDGPRGPRYCVQPGVIAAAQLTGLPIVPASCWIGWKKTLRTWDGFQIPIPFSRVEVRIGEPLWVPRDCDPETRENLRRELEKVLAELTT